MNAKGCRDWLERKTTSRLVSPDQLVNGDIAMKLPDGRLLLVGSGGSLYAPSPWERLLAWLRTP